MRQVKAEYTGETSRTAYLRGREHWEGLESEKEKNPLWKHCMEKHGGTKVNFNMKVLRSHRTPLSRQVHESVEIDSSKADIVMNSKGEWNGSRLPRIIIEVGEELQEDEEDTMAGTNTKIKAGPIFRSGENWKINNTKKRKSYDESSPGTKRRRINGSGIDKTGVKQEHPECSQAQSKKNKKISTENEEQRKESKESKLMKRWLTRKEKLECGKAQPKEWQDEEENTECGLTQPITNAETTSRNVGECDEERRKSTECRSAQSPEWPKNERREGCGLTQPIENAEFGENVRAQIEVENVTKLQEEGKATACGLTQPVNKAETGENAECGMVQSERGLDQSLGISLRKRKRNGRRKYKLKKTEEKMKIDGAKCGNEYGMTKSKLTKPERSKCKAVFEMDKKKATSIKNEGERKTECAQAQSPKSETDMSNNAQ